MIRPILPEELDSVCDQIAELEPWRRLEIMGEVMASNIRFDTEREVLVWSESGVILGAVIYRRSHFAQLVYFHGFGEQLAQLNNLQWPNDWSEIPDGGYVAGLAVFDGARGKGIGSRLLEAAENEARQAGMLRNYLMVTDYNLGAQRLYERHSYRRIATRDNCLRPGNREHLMEKLL